MSFNMLGSNIHFHYEAVMEHSTSFRSPVQTAVGHTLAEVDFNLCWKVSVADNYTDHLFWTVADSLADHHNSFRNSCS